MEKGRKPLHFPYRPLCLALLSVSGYVEKAPTQSARSLHGIWIIMTLLPIVGYAIMIIIMGIYKLDEKKVEEMLEHNKRREINA